MTTPHTPERAPTPQKYDIQQSPGGYRLMRYGEDFGQTNNAELQFWQQREQLAAELAALQARNDAMEEVLSAATVWFGYKKPLAWSSAKHFENPAINTSYDYEEKLARAVASYFNNPDNFGPAGIKTEEAT